MPPEVPNAIPSAEDFKTPARPAFLDEFEKRYKEHLAAENAAVAEKISLACDARTVN